MGYLTHLNVGIAFKKLELFELGLNKLGYIPLVGTGVSYLRSALSVVQVIAAIAISAFALYSFFAGQLMFPFYVQVASKLLGHGILNYVRQHFESQPFIPLITCLPYDWYFGRKIFSYLR